MDVTAADARDALARSAHLLADTFEQRIRVALIALRTTYASRCSEPHALGWGWRSRGAGLAADTVATDPQVLLAPSGGAGCHTWGGRLASPVR